MLDVELVGSLEDLIGYQLRRASSHVMSELVRALDRLDLRPGEASVLLLIRDRPHVTQSDIGRELGIKRANMAPLAACLERRGLLQRTRVDGRSQGLSLTDDGERLAAQARAAMDANDDRFFARLSSEQRRQLHSILVSIWS